MREIRLSGSVRGVWRNPYPTATILLPLHRSVLLALALLMQPGTVKIALRSHTAATQALHR